MSKIVLTENDIKRIVKESVVKVLNELSSDYLKKANYAFYKKYGSQFYPGELTNSLEKDEYGNPLHPKDGRPISQHYRDFRNAIHNAQREEDDRD